MNKYPMDQSSDADAFQRLLRAARETTNANEYRQRLLASAAAAQLQVPADNFLGSGLLHTQQQQQQQRIDLMGIDQVNKVKQNLLELLSDSSTALARQRQQFLLEKQLESQLKLLHRQQQEQQQQQQALQSQIAVQSPFEQMLYSSAVPPSYAGNNVTTATVGLDSMIPSHAPTFFPDYSSRKRRRSPDVTIFPLSLKEKRATFPLPSSTGSGCTLHTGHLLSYKRQWSYLNQHAMSLKREYQPSFVKEYFLRWLHRQRNADHLFRKVNGLSAAAKSPPRYRGRSSFRGPG